MPVFLLLSEREGKGIHQDQVLLEIALYKEAKFISYFCKISNTMSTAEKRRTKYWLKRSLWQFYNKVQLMGVCGRHACMERQTQHILTGIFPLVATETGLRATSWILKKAGNRHWYFLASEVAIAGDFKVDWHGKKPGRQPKPWPTGRSPLQGTQLATAGTLLSGSSH